MKASGVLGKLKRLGKWLVDGSKTCVAVAYGKQMGGSICGLLCSKVSGALCFCGSAPACLIVGAVALMLVGRLF